MRLDSDKKMFENMIERTSDFLNIRREYVEKDYWLSLLLKEIFKHELDYVFKGGTSLSKCHHLINRFSEDIDISYEKSYFASGVGEIERKYKGISSSIKTIGLSVLHTEKLNRDGYFNRFECPYPSMFDDGNIEKKVIIELAAQTPSFPSEIKPIQSFIGEYLDRTGRHELTIQYELESFSVRTQSLERTLVDKIFAICDYYLSNKCAKHSRHLYDISKILEKISFDENTIMLFKEVREHRKKNDICYSARNGVVISDLLTKIIEEESFKMDYNNLTLTLLYEICPYSKCELVLIKIRDQLKNNDL